LHRIGVLRCALTVPEGKVAARHLAPPGGMPGVGDEQPLEDEGGEIRPARFARRDAEQVVVVRPPGMRGFVGCQELPGLLGLAVPKQRFGLSEIGPLRLRECATRCEREGEEPSSANAWSSRSAAPGGAALRRGWPA
jgi:hypothetical protein